MGRRAKNKQGPPQSLGNEFPPTSKYGKRKAEDEGSAAPRQNKKLKHVFNKKPQSTPKSNPTAPNAKGRSQKGSDGKIQKNQVQFEEDADKIDSGWEDVDEEEENLKAQAKYAHFSNQYFLLFSNLVCCQVVIPR